MRIIFQDNVFQQILEAQKLRTTEVEETIISAYTTDKKDFKLFTAELSY